MRLIVIILIIVFILGIVIVSAVVMSREHQRKLEALAASRRGEREGDDWSIFVGGLDQTPHDEEAARAVFEELRSYLSVPDFPLRGDDNPDTLIIDDEDWEYLAERSLARAGRFVPPDSGGPVVISNLRDMVRMVAGAPRNPMNELIP